MQEAIDKLEKLERLMTKERKKKRKILLVGGAGYVGTVLTEYLLERGYHVRLLDLLVYNHDAAIKPFLAHENFEFIYSDYGNANITETVLKDTTDIVFLAGLVGDYIAEKYPQASEIINEKGIINFLNRINNKKLHKFIFISTCSNYGFVQENSAANENFELKPLSRYAKAKVAVENYILSLKNKIDFIPTILRFSTAFGLSSRMRFDLTVNQFTRDLYLEKTLEVYDAQTWRPYCHVLDFAKAIEMVLNAQDEKICFEVFNVGSDQNNFNKHMIIDEIKKYLPQSKIIYKEHGHDQRNYRVNFKKINDVLSFQALYPVSDGVAEVLTALKQGQFQDVEKIKNFYGNYTIHYVTNI